MAGLENYNKEKLQHLDTIVSDPHSLKNSLSLWASLSPMNSETQGSKYFHGMGNFTYLSPYSIPALFKWKTIHLLEQYGAKKYS